MGVGQGDKTQPKEQAEVRCRTYSITVTEYLPGLLGLLSL